jgi:3-oxoacyl-[acyl-carrier-protein] synthase III
MSNFRTKFKGTGHYLPEKVVTNDDLSKLVDTNHQWIVERTGICERRISDPVKDVPSSMAQRAAEMAIKDAGLNPNDIDCILFSVTIGDMFFPNTASVLQEKLGITNQCACLDINAACSGWVYGLTVANSFIQTGLYKNILLIGCEMTSRFNNWKDRNSCILFGDGCGAVVLGRAEANDQSEIYSSILTSDSSKKDSLILYAGGAAKAITHEILDKEEQYVTMNGQEVFKAAVKTMASHCATVLQKANLKPQDIKWFIPHQANLRIIEATANRLEFPMEKVIVNVAKTANTSSASIPIALDEAVRDGRIKRGDYMIFAAFGAGLTSGAVCLRY